jgi:hypothetical protein
MAITAPQAAALVLADFHADFGAEADALTVYTVWASDSQYAVEVAPKIDPEKSEGIGLVLVDSASSEITHLGSWEDPAPVLATMHEVPFED